MPKLKKTVVEKSDIAVKAIWTKHLIELGYTPNQVAEWLTISKTTYFQRRKKPESMTMREFRILSKKLNFTDREVCEMIGITYKGETA